MRLEPFEVQDHTPAHRSEPLCAELIRAALADHPWRDRLCVLDSVDSTNVRLRQLAADGAPAGTVVIADRQSAGRGRMGRSFVSEPGVGIYLSVLLRPNCRPDALMTLTAQAAVAVCTAIDRVCGVRPAIKWVNDLLLEGKKICGILSELSINAVSGLTAFAVVGVGVNCNQLSGDFPHELQPIAGSIRMATGAVTPRNLLAAELIRQLSALPALDWYVPYRRSCLTLGRRICFSDSNGIRTAEALDVGPNAELCIRYDDGTAASLNSGEVSFHGLP